MWNIREKSLNTLSSTLKTESSIIYEGFDLLDEILDAFSNLTNSTTFSRVTSLILAKGRNLCHGLFSLELDGLAQEAGAILRPLVECIELLCYLEQNPEKAESILSDKKPSAGEIAQAISGDFQDLRQYLNNHSSHLSVSVESMNHLIDWKSEQFTIRKQPEYSEVMLKRNLTILFCFLVFLSREGAKCCIKCDGLPEYLAIKIDYWKLRGQNVLEDRK